MFKGGREKEPEMFELDVFESLRRKASVHERNMEGSSVGF